MRNIKIFLSRSIAPSFLRSLRRAVSQLPHNRRGNVLVLTGFALIPLTFATGMVIDYSRAARLQTKLNAAADAGALSATTKPMLDKPIEAACNVARRTFRNALEQSNKGLTFNNAEDLTISITESYPTGSDVTKTCATGDAAVPSSATLPITRSITVRYAGLSHNAFGGVLGAATIPIGGLSTARASTGAYYQIVFLVDISSSMAIGGTPADISNLSGDKTIQCSFACHDPNALMAVSASDYCNSNPLDSSCRSDKNYCPSGRKCGTINPSPTYSDRSTLARLYGYKLKVDFVKDALNSFMTKLKPKMDAKPTNYDVALYTFGSEFKEARSKTNKASEVQTAIDQIDIEVAKRYLPSYSNQGWTFTSAGLQGTLNKISNIGDGSSATQRKTYVIFLSDGVEDDIGTVIYNRGTYYNYMAKCNAIKNAGITMFSIETAYPVVTDDKDGQYRKLVTDLPGRNGGLQLADAMKSCASSANRYFMADDGPGIQSAVESVFASIDAETSRLSQ